MGIVVAGSSLGGVTLPIALGQMLHNSSLGFGRTLRICGFIILTILSLSGLGIRPRLPPRTSQLFLPAAFKAPHYVAIIAASFLMILGFFVPFFYIPTYATDHGMSAELASYLISILNGASFLGRIVPGVLADRLGRLNMLFAAALSTSILLFVWPSITTNAGIIVFAAIYGFCSGAIISLFAVCLATVPKDPRNIGTYLGMGKGIISLAALIGPPINGALLSHYGGFHQVSIFSGVVVFAGSGIVVLAKHVSGKGVSGKI